MQQKKWQRNHRRVWKEEWEGNGDIVIYKKNQVIRKDSYEAQP